MTPQARHGPKEMDGTLDGDGWLLGRDDNRRGDGVGGGAVKSTPLDTSYGYSDPVQK